MVAAVLVVYVFKEERKTLVYIYMFKEERERVITKSSISLSIPILVALE